MSRSSRPTCSVLAGTVVVSALALLFVVYRALTGAGPLFDFGDGDTNGGGGATSTAWFDVWFTDPTGPASNTLRGGPDAHLAESIEGARLTVDVAIYDLDLWSIRDALLGAHRRGVAVRVVTESDNLDEPEVQDLIDAGIPVLADRREGLMHNKFVIVDWLDVWTGSMNFTVNGAYRNDNNLVRMRSSRLARNYLVEFEEMFVSDRFGPGSPANAPQPVMDVDDSQVEHYFSPDDGTADRLIELVRQADESVIFLAFSFTSDDLAAALIDQERDGVSVRGSWRKARSGRISGPSTAGCAAQVWTCTWMATRATCTTK